VVGGTEYTFWVAASNYIGLGSQSLSLKVLASQVPDAPEAPVLTATYNSIQMSWAAPNN
jgi:hypothetical protein